MDIKNNSNAYIESSLIRRSIKKSGSIEGALALAIRQFIEAKDYRTYPPGNVPTKMDACDEIACVAEARPDLITEEIQDHLVRQFDSCNEATHLVILRILAILKARRHLPFFEKILTDKKWHDWTLQAAEEGVAVINGTLKIAPHPNLGTRWIFNRFSSEISPDDPSLQALIEKGAQSTDKKPTESGQDQATKDRDRQVRQLREIYDGALMAPKFRRMKKFQTEKDPGPPFIRYSDVMKDRYIIRRGGKDWMNSFCDEETEVIAAYNSLAELVNDGWRLD